MSTNPKWYSVYHLTILLWLFVFVCLIFKYPSLSPGDFVGLYLMAIGFAFILSKRYMNESPVAKYLFEISSQYAVNRSEVTHLITGWMAIILGILSSAIFILQYYPEIEKYIFQIEVLSPWFRELIAPFSLYIVIIIGSLLVLGLWRIILKHRK